jgi:hypothetical protein
MFIQVEHVRSMCIKLPSRYLPSGEVSSPFNSLIQGELIKDIIEGYIAMVYNGEEDRIYILKERNTDLAFPHNKLETLVQVPFNFQRDFETVCGPDNFDMISRKKYRITVEEINL